MNWVHFIIGISASMFIFYNFGTYKNRPILSVFFVILRRCKYTKWLMYNIPFTGDDNWYYDLVEAAVFGKNP